MEHTNSDATPGEETPETPLRKLIADFLASKEERGSGAYRASAESELDRFADWMERRGYELEDLDYRQDGPQVMRMYAKRLRRRVNGDGIAPSTANTYYSYISACLSYGVRDMVLSQNPALTETAKEELPADESKRSDQQFWSPEQREQLVEYVRGRAADAIDEQGFDAYPEARDRSLVIVLSYSGVRGAEILRHRKDSRRGRQGVRWEQIDLDAGTMEVLGKSKSEEKRWQHASLPRPAREALEQLKRVQRPPSDQWRVFETSHAPSLYEAARAELPEKDIEDLLEIHGSIREVLRVEKIEPPALTTDGARSLMQRLTEAAEIDLPDGADYLQPHGARRGLGEEIYRKDRGTAQDVLRHEELTTTKEHYQHIDAAERTEVLDRLLDDTSTER